jgi:two-component system, NtrC family, sensor histidine kinase HydH
MGPRTKTISLIVSIAASILLALLVCLSLKSRDDIDRLGSLNDSERTLNTLWESLKDNADFGSGIEANEELKEKVIGVGIYASDGSRVYGWGDSPESYSKENAARAASGNASRAYIEKPATDSIVLLRRPSQIAPRPERGEPGPPPDDAPKGDLADGRDEPPLIEAEKRLLPEFFETLRKGEIVYLELRQTAFWRGRRLRLILFPILSIILAAGVFFVRSIFLGNLEFRRRIEEQKSLVILGTAASTLAHEIKTPIMSIRIQTGILEKLYPGQAAREIGIINFEIERLSLLSYRVNDYIREPRGNPSLIDPSEIIRDAGTRMFGRDIALVKAEVRIRMDPERLRSVIENLLRNAAESGSSENDIGVEIKNENGMALIEVLDRGQGISPEDRKKLFHTFFTTKSRGSGIGLTICRRFVESVSGSISLEERPGGGTRVRISIPEAKR